MIKIKKYEIKKFTETDIKNWAKSKHLKDNIFVDYFVQMIIYIIFNIKI